MFKHDGHCPIWEKAATFSSKEQWFRDHLLCPRCGSIPRERALMKVIGDFYPNWRALKIHETCGRGASVKLDECDGYTASQYYLDIEPGRPHPISGYRCENLEKLTFPDESFDLFVSLGVRHRQFHRREGQYADRHHCD
jgi:hypothetical protein